MARVIQFKPVLHYIDCPGFDVSKYEAFREDIIKSFESNYLFCVEMMSEDDEIRIKAMGLYGRIQTDPFQIHKDIITQHLAELWEAVCGNIDNYYGSESDITKLLKNLMIQQI